MVVSYNQLLVRDYGGRLDEEACEFINYSIQGGLRMQTLLTGLRQYWQTSEKGMEQRAQVDCNQALQQAKLNLEAAILESGAEITSDPLPVIYAEELALVQLFQNLIGNAIKYRTEHQPLIHVSSQSRSGVWHFAVKDNGIGIEPEHLTTIFGVFKRLHGSRYPGAGIGLAICRKLVERHGGRIWVDSEYGRGSTFRFTIKDTESSIEYQKRIP